MCSRFQCTQWDFKYGQGYGEVCSRTLQATEALRFLRDRVSDWRVGRVNIGFK